MADTMMEPIRASAFSFTKAKSLRSSNNTFKATNGPRK